MAPADGEDGPTGPDWLAFLVGFIGFVGSAIAYGLALLTGSDVTVSLAVNAAAALLLIGWAANATLADPASTVRTLPGAIGTALLLVGAYLVGAAVVVGFTSVWHGRFSLAIALGVTGVVAGVGGLAMFPIELVVGDAESESDDGPA